MKVKRAHEVAGAIVDRDDAHVRKLDLQRGRGNSDEARLSGWSSEDHVRVMIHRAMQDAVRTRVRVTVCAVGLTVRATVVESSWPVHGRQPNWSVLPSVEVMADDSAARDKTELTFVLSSVCFV